MLIALGVTLWIFPTLKGNIAQPAEQESPGQGERESESGKLSRDVAKVQPNSGSIAATQRRIDAVSPTVEPNTGNMPDFRRLTIEDLWALYTQPAGIDPAIRAQAAKWISEKVGESASGYRKVHQEIAAKLLNEASDEGERLGLARILGESNTPEGLATLVETVLSTRNLPLQRSIIEQLGRMGGRRSPEQVSALSEAAVNAWQRIPDRSDLQPALLSTVSGILAKLGEPVGISLLRTQAVQGGTTLAEFDAKASDASQAAMNASLQVRGPQSVPLLTDALQKSDPTSTEFVWSGQALASMGRPEATSALIEWAKGAPDSCAETAAAWIGAVRDSRSHALVRELAASGAQMQFASSLVKQAVLASADKLATQ
jgi:hypothetical protein